MREETKSFHLLLPIFSISGGLEGGVELFPINLPFTEGTDKASSEPVHLVLDLTNPCFLAEVAQKVLIDNILYMYGRC